MIQRTKVLTLIVFGLLFLNLSAQENEFSDDRLAKLPDDDRKFRIGLQFNPSISWLQTNTVGYNNDGTKLGFSYGLSLEYFMSKNYLFSSGFNILNTGGSLSYGASPLEINEKFKIKYIEIPLLLKLRTNEIGYLTYYGQFGFNAGFNFNSKSKYKNLSGVSSTTSVGTTEDRYDDVETSFLNLSLVIGAGVEYNLSGNTTLALGITYNNGFINQLDAKVFEYDANGVPLINSSGDPVYSEKEASANLNYIALNIGIYF